MTFAPIILIDVRVSCCPVVTWRLTDGRVALGKEEAVVLIRHRCHSLPCWRRCRFGQWCGNASKYSSDGIYCVRPPSRFLASRASCFNILSRSFAIGIGPVPFVMIPEVSPHHVRIYNFCQSCASAEQDVVVGCIRAIVHWAVAQLYVHLTPAIPRQTDEFHSAQGSPTSSSALSSFRSATSSRTATSQRRAASSSCSPRF